MEYLHVPDDSPSAAAAAAAASRPRDSLVTCGKRGDRTSSIILMGDFSTYKDRVVRPGVALLDFCGTDDWI